VSLLPAKRPFTAFEAGGQFIQNKRLLFGVTNGVSTCQFSIDNFMKKHGIFKKIILTT